MGPVQYLEVGHIVHDHVYEVVEVAGHQVAAHHLGSVGNRGLEGVKCGLGLADEGYLDEDVGAEADRRGVDQCHVAVYVAAVLEAPYPSQARRR